MNDIQNVYEQVVAVLSTYMDIPDDYKQVISLWAIAVSFKDCFITFPFLFINASKGSGKTRLLKILEHIIPKSKLTPNLTGASLYRLPSQQKLNALLIDEAERVTSKEKSELRELLNQAYKKGGAVLRIEEDQSRKFVVKEYPVFMGVALANILGLEPVLEDRCISIILEKSNNPLITKLPEYFDLDERIQAIKNSKLPSDEKTISLISGVSQYFFYYLYNHTLPTQPTLHTLPTLPALPTLLDRKLMEDLPSDPDIFCGIVEKSELMGRDLEVWLPLLIISYFISEEFLIDTVNLAQHFSKEKREMQIMEDRDTIFASFICYYIKANELQDSYIVIQKLQKKFFENDGEKDWCSPEWIGRCLNRIKAVKDRVRVAKGVKVLLNLNKIEDYLKKRGITIKEEDILDYKSDTEEKQTTL